MMDGRRYGYLTHENNIGIVQMMKGQNISGFPIGIIYIEDVWYPMVPGNIVNGYTFDFPVRLKAVEGLDIEQLFNPDKYNVFEKILAAAKSLEREGVRAVSGACGFFGNYQKQLAEAVDIPVALSSLVQIPWIFQLLKSNQKIGVLTADMSSLSDNLLENCGAARDRLVIKDLCHAPEFSAIIEGRGSFDNGKVCDEIVEKAMEIVSENDNIGAILLECSDMPPYARDVQTAVKLPVFDFTTLIKWLESAVCQKGYNGFI